MVTQTAKLTDLVGKTHDGSVAMPAAGTTIATTLEPGAYTQFLFKMNQIDTVNLRPDGALEMKLTNGSTLVVQNFQALADSAESCGRDTVFQMLKEVPAGNNGATGLQIVNISPDALLRALDPTLAASKDVTINEPGPGMTREVVMEPGQAYKFNFEWGSAAKTVDGTNLMLSFKNGGLVILRDFVPVTSGDLPPALTLADGTVLDADQLIATACAPSGTFAMKAPEIEPAAGDHAPVRKAVPVQAQQLADIEPAAGGGDSPASGGRGGAGFSSGIDPANLNGLNPLGPIGPTSLLYGIPSVNDFPVGTVPTASEPPTEPPVEPPPGPEPTLVVRDERVYEDGSVGLNVQTTAPDGMTTVITISGFPAGWTVDAGLGTFDPQTRTWTITLPAGADFSGGPIIHPPFNADDDIPMLNVTATNTNVNTGVTTTNTGVIGVVTDAVADAPNLAVSAPANGVQDQPVDITASSSLNDTDGSEVLSIRVTGVPAGSSLSAGLLQNDGSYLLTAAQLNGLKFVPSQGFIGDVTLTFTAIATETNFSGGEFDFTNNVAETVRVINISYDQDDQPTITNSECPVDETDLIGGFIGVAGAVHPQYGTDGPGTVTPTSLASFVPGGSLFNGTLTSNGVPVVVEINGDSYVGWAATNVAVFMLTVNPDGTYEFYLFENLDHADNSDPNDVITLSFGVVATDIDGDTAEGVITINVFDDGPIAQNDVGVLSGGVAIGNVTNNDSAGQDNPGQVTSVTVNGVTTPISQGGLVTIAGLFGTLVIASNGAYSYTATNGVSGTDVFTYTLNDREGDQSTATLTITSNDGLPSIGDSAQNIDETNLGPININGNLVHSFGGDGAGAITAEGASSFSSGGSKLNGVLSSNGDVITVTLQGNTYIGQTANATIFTLQVNADGTYAFQLLGNLDHADGNNPDDVITLGFGVKITDSDGDSDTGVISVSVRDDAPIASDDTGVLVAGIATGNVTANDTVGQDDPGRVSAVMVNGSTTLVNANGTTTIVGLFGTLVIAANGAYTYTAANGANGTDSFTYTLIDRDGDRDTAILSITSADGRPTIGDSTQNIDETNLGPINVGGNVAHSFGNDGPGAITAEGAISFNATGSRLGNTLSSGGVPVIVTLDGNTYTGKAGNVTVFTLQVNADGSYNFELRDNLDHADRFNPNDVITLNFGVKITDSDGDSDTGVITINVLDDAPVPLPDQNVANNLQTVTGNVLINDASTENPYVSFVTFNGQTFSVAPNGQTTVVGAYGTLTIERDGDYTYTPKNDVITTTMSPECDDVIASDTMPTFTKNGVTIQAINHVTGAVGTDLSWVFDDNNVGNTGIGVNTGAVNGPTEAMRITYGSEPADAVWITIGNWSPAEQAAGVLMAKVYFPGNDTPTVIALTGGVPGPFAGIMSYKIDAEALFNNKPFSKVELFLNDPNDQYSYTLINVSVERYSEGTDVFGYTVTDFDGDSANSTLSITTDNDNLGQALQNAIIVDDEVTVAISDFVEATTPDQPALIDTVVNEIRVSDGFGSGRLDSMPTQLILPENNHQDQAA